MTPAHGWWWWLSPPSPGAASSVLGVSLAEVHSRKMRLFIRKKMNKICPGLFAEEPQATREECSHPGWPFLMYHVLICDIMLLWSHTRKMGPAGR